MNTAVTPVKTTGAVAGFSDQEQFVTVHLADQLFGIPVLLVHDVLQTQRITKVPLAPPDVAGSLNLRGRIVTAIDMRCRLGMAPQENKSWMSVVVENHGELYSLLVDSVGEVLTLSAADFERNPPTLPGSWRDLSAGIYRLKDRLMVVFDVGRLLNINKSSAAA